jgi:ubiquinone/menaquinone biosynthesis C-methylase UbiE
MSRKHKETIQKQFTKTLQAFSKYAVRDTPEVMAEKVEFAKAQPSDAILDVACGPGAFVLALAPRARLVLGVDLTLPMLRQACTFQAEKRIPNAAFACGDAEQLPFPDAAFDLVTCQCSFHHMPDPKLALQEMVRVMKPGGRLLIIDTLAPESEEKFELHNRIEKLRDPSHALTLRWTTFRTMFEPHALKIAEEKFRRRQRSFNQWMLRAGHNPGTKRYLETRQLLEESMAGDKGGLSPQLQGEDILITHNEGMFMLQKTANPEGSASSR